MSDHRRDEFCLFVCFFRCRLTRACCFCVAFLRLVTTGTSVLGDSDNQTYLITHKH